MTGRLRSLSRVNLVLAGMGAIAFACLLPVLFHPLFSLEPIDAWMLGWLHRGQKIVGGGVVLMLLLAWRSRPGPLAALYLGMLLLLGSELGLRLWVKHAADPSFVELSMAPIPVMDEGSPEGTHAGHPFLQYTAQPHVGDYNYLGFKGADHSHDKAAGTLRVALLGASTTEWGLDEGLRPFLNQGLEATPFARAEILNFGLAGWTSTHSAANFLLNVIDFSPDVVVVHHGWNDDEFETGLCPRGDYASRLVSHPVVQDETATVGLLRLSAIYRLAMVEIMLRQDAPMGCCGDAKASLAGRLNDAGPTDGRSCSDVFALKGEHWPLERNLRSIVQLARANEILPIILTMPHSTDPTKARRGGSDVAAHLDQTNEVNRKASAETGALLVDLDAHMTGENQLFTDVAHVSTTGNRVKGRHIAAAILGHFATAAD
jgi:hypothetical protein